MNQPTGMILLASEQIWPNLQGLLHWHCHERFIRKVYILHSGDRIRSKEPAQRFQDLIHSTWPDMEVELSGDVEPEPILVQDNLTAWLDRNPDMAWVLNLTGGTKLMFAGGLPLIRRDHVTAIYREISGHWFFLHDDAGVGTRVVPFAVDPHVTDQIPVGALIRLQAGSVKGGIWTLSQVEGRTLAPILKAISTRDGLDLRRLSRFYRNAGHGFRFEAFLADCIKAFGVESVALNVELIDPGGNKLMEVDVLANLGGKLYVFDAKTGKQTPMSSQIKEAVSVRQKLGGYGAVATVVRPDKETQPHQLDILQLMGVKHIDKKSMPNLFTNLGNILNLPLTQEMCQWEGQWDARSKASRVDKIPASPNVKSNAPAPFTGDLANALDACFQIPEHPASPGKI